MWVDIDKFGSCVKNFVNFYFDPRFIVQTWSYCIKEHEEYKIILTEMRNYDLWELAKLYL